MIARHGNVIFEAYNAPYAAEIPHIMHSFTKTLTNTAVALAHDDGLLDLGDPILKYFPEYEPEAEKSKDAKDGQPEPDIGVQEKAEKDKLLDELMGKPVQKEENAPNPSVAKTEKSPQSEPTLEQPKKSAEGATMTKEKPSVREELRKIKESRKEWEAEIGTSDLDKSGASDRAKSANRKTEHKQPPRKKKKPKSKETR